MATLSCSSSSALLFTSSSQSSNSPAISLFPLPRLSFSNFSFSSSLSISPISRPSASAISSRRVSISDFNVVKVTAEKRKVLIVNTNSGGHAVIGFYFAKELLSSGHDVTILTVGEESSDKMKKPPFSRFSVKLSILIASISYLFFFFSSFDNCYANWEFV